MKTQVSWTIEVGKPFDQKVTGMFDAEKSSSDGGNFLFLWQDFALVTEETRPALIEEWPAGKFAIPS